MTEEGDGDLYYEIAELPKRLQARKLRSFALAGLYANRFAGQPREIIHRDPRPAAAPPAVPAAPGPSAPTPDMFEAEPEAAIPESPIPAPGNAENNVADTGTIAERGKQAGKPDALSMIDTSVMD